eukprot:Ihof_evm20s27 gene=Ihof_evmTU20s27
MTATVKEGVNLTAKAARYIPTSVDPMELPDMSFLDCSDEDALVKLVEASKYINEIYIRQVWSGNVALREELEQGCDADLLNYFKINGGPWDRLDFNEPFIADVPTKPPTSNFYPEDMDKEEFNAWIATLSDEDKAKARGFYHVIRRDPMTCELYLVPYSEEYKEFLVPAAQSLREAAELVTDASLARFLRLSAEAFLNNNYSASDAAWVDVSADSPLEVTIGPYEVYEDTLFAYKSAYEAYISIRDREATAKIAHLADLMQELEDNLPVDPKYRNPKLGDARLIVVVNQLCNGGDVTGPQTAAYNLPNNEEVINEKGSKMVILKNVQERKFKKILLPIANVSIPADQRDSVSFDAFFTHILAHEMCHTLGPKFYTGPDGEKRPVREALEELHSTIEEAKADILGLWSLQYQIDKGLIDSNFTKPLYTTFVASSFRSIRFGLDEAHGRGQALQLTYMMKHGAVIYEPITRTFRVNFEKMPKVVE